MNIKWFVLIVQFILIVGYVYHHNRCMQLYCHLQSLNQKIREQHELCKDLEARVAVITSFDVARTYANEAGMVPVAKKNIIVMDIK